MKLQLSNKPQLRANHIVAWVVILYVYRYKRQGCDMFTVYQCQWITVSQSGLQVTKTRFLKDTYHNKVTKGESVFNLFTTSFIFRWVPCVSYKRKVSTEFTYFKPVGISSILRYWWYSLHLHKGVFSFPNNMPQFPYQTLQIYSSQWIPNARSKQFQGYPCLHTLIYDCWLIMARPVKITTS